MPPPHPPQRPSLAPVPFPAHSLPLPLPTAHRPQDVEALDLEAYNQHLVASEGEAANKLATLIDIQQEFVEPYGELRHKRVALEVGATGAGAGGGPGTGRHVCEGPGV